MRTILAMLAALATAFGPACAGAADNTGDRTPSTSNSWPQWQGRISLGNGPDGPGRLGVPAARQPFGSASLMGDYYFASSWVPDGQRGGFRATSGLTVGPRGSSLALAPGAAAGDGSSFSIGHRTLPSASLLPGSDPAGDGSATVPYVGFGYTGLAVRSGWSYSADLGLSGGSTRLGRALGAGQNLDDAIRDLRMAPVVQVGVSYAF